MFTPEDIASWAEAHDQAEQRGVPMSQMTLAAPEATLEDAYAVQRAWVDLKLSRGQRRIGRKIGLTSRAMQRAARIEEPDYGVLLDTMRFEDASRAPVERFIRPRVEIELAFVLKSDLHGAECTLLDVLAATEVVMPAIEIIDARSHSVDPETQRPRTVRDTIADNAANAGVILGGRPMRPMEIDLRWVGGILFRNGIVEETGLAAGVLGHPAQGPAWLARKLAPFGEGLSAGEIILGGSFTAPVPAAAGDTFHADYGPLGSVSVQFV